MISDEFDKKLSFDLISDYYRHWSHQIRRVLGLPFKGFHPGCPMVVSRIQVVLRLTSLIKVS